MTKRRRPIHKKKRIRRKDAYKIATLLDDAQASLIAGRHAEALGSCNAVLAIAAPRSRQRAEALAFKANALAMLKRFDEAYDTLALALEIAPDDPYLWYNKGLAAVHTSRFGEAVLNLRRAVELEGDGRMAGKFAKKLAFVDEIARKEQAVRGPDFTLEQLIEQQALFRQGMDLFRAGDWREAEQYFRQSIEMGDCLSQPWGNLGVCLLMQERYDEAEAAFKRALEIDPDYELARANLRNLAQVRTSGIPPIVGVTSPFQDVNVSLDVTFEDE